MNPKPKCIIVTGPAGSGKTTLAKKLGERLWMPAISRDEIKEGYVNTFGVRHDELPAETNGLVSKLFFKIANRYLAAHISIIIEAAFQHDVWESKIEEFSELASVWVILCAVDLNVAAKRHLERGLANPDREWFHGDNRVTHYRKTRGVLAPAHYEIPTLDVPTIKVATDGEYVPSIDEIVTQVRSSEYQQSV